MAVVSCLCLIPSQAWVTKPSASSSWTSPTFRLSTVALQMSDSPAEPTTFREAEVLGLRLMQEGDYEGALNGTCIYSMVCLLWYMERFEFNTMHVSEYYTLTLHMIAFQKGLKLPGSKKDVVRTKLVSGPSPVGGSAGGTESTSVQSLDEFELQAAHYNMACAYAKLDNPTQAVANLKLAFDNGFDNYATVRSDPDLKILAGDAEFDALMEKVDSQRGGFNPFGFLKK